VAAVLLLPGVLRGVTLRRAAPVADGVMLGCAVLDAARQAQLIGPLTPSTLRRQLTLWLAGRAAEIDHLGEASAGAGGPDDSDLARATDLATRALASGGLGRGPEALLWHAAGSAAQACRLLREHPALRQQVAATLAAAEAAALDLVRAQHKAVAEVAQRLLQHGEVRASQVTSVVQRMATSP
jgi:ATP-dependent Zn protease